MGGGRVKSRLSRTLNIKGCASDVSTRRGVERGSRIRAAGGVCSEKKSLAMTLAVMREEEEATQEVAPLDEDPEKRFERTRTRENAQIHAATHSVRVRRRGRGVRSNGIRTPPRNLTILILHPWG